MDKAQKNSSQVIPKELQQGLGLYIPHPDIQVNRAELNWQDGVYLMEVSLDIFLTDIQQGLQKALGLSVRVTSQAEAWPFPWLEFIG